MRFLLRLAAALAFTSFSVAQQNAPDSVPDTIYVNGNIFTNSSSEVQRAQAMAVKNGKFVQVGSNRDVRKSAGKKTKIVDLKRAFVMPGFNDAHAHLASGGFEKLNVNLNGSKTLQQMQQRIQAAAASAGNGEWITGRGWDHTVWPTKALPTRQDIDKVTGDHPAIFTRADGHIAVVNSAALKAADITRNTPDPAGGKIDRGEVDEATGILRETAMELVTAKVPGPSKEKRRQAVALALAEAARWGVTSVQDNSQWDDFLVYEELLKSGQLTARITEWLTFDEPLEKLKKARAYRSANDPMLRTGMLKGYMDGSLGSSTAALLAPYSDDPKNSGIPRYTQAQLDQLTQERVTEGFQLGFHAIGDKGTEMALIAFDKAMKATGKKDLRFRIEHDQVIDVAQFSKYKKLGVIASMQPNHLLTDMNWAEERIGKTRAKTSYPWAEFLENDVPLAFGTDYPVEPITPFRGLYAAVTRKNEEGDRVYVPEQKLTIEQAMAAYTSGAAFAEFAEKEKGRIEPGMFADFVVLDRDLTKVPAEKILGTKVLRTVVGGKTVYQSTK